MFIGHYALALAAKKSAPSLSLGTSFVAAQFIDLVWPVFILAGIEHVRIDPGNTVVTPLDFYHYPVSHSLAACVVWAVLLGAFYYLRARHVRRAAILSGLVLSHWLLDLVAHRPDLPLVPGVDIYVGLGLWNSLAGTLVVEVILFAIGCFIYHRTTRPRDAVGRYGWLGLVLLLCLIYLANIFGPPPPSVEAIGFAGLGLWLIVFLARWVDAHRVATGPSYSRSTQ